MQKLIRGSFVLQLIILCIWNLGYAQVKGVFVGDDVRISAPGISDDPIRGEVIVVSSYLIQILAEDEKVGKIDIPIDTIEQLEIRYFISQKQKGTKIGAAIGGVTVGIYSLIREIESGFECEEQIVCKNIDESTSVFRVLGMSAIGTITGGALGYLVGSQIKVAKWRDVPLQLTMESLSPKYLDRVSTVGLTLKYRFSF